MSNKEGEDADNKSGSCVEMQVWVILEDKEPHTTRNSHNNQLAKEQDEVSHTVQSSQPERIAHQHVPSLPTNKSVRLLILCFI